MPDRTAKAVAAIARKMGGDRIQDGPEILTCYSFDATNTRSRPAAVAFPRSTEEVRTAVTVCHQWGIPIVPRGAGTGFAGGTVPVEGGVVISTEKLRKIVSIDPAEKVTVVQAGVINGTLQREAAKYGLMFPPDPSSLEVATIGGNVAQDAGGPRAIKYGVTRDYVLGVEFVTWEGSVVQPGHPGVRSIPWDPMSSIMTSSEGTLGVITKVWLRLVTAPSEFVTLLVFFTSPVDAAAAVSRVLDRGVMPAAVELVDSQTMECINAYVEVEVPRGAGCLLLIETDGREGEAKDAMSKLVEVLPGTGAISTRAAESASERDHLWKMRRSISPSLARIAPCKLNEDVCVPRSRLPDLVEKVGKLSEKYDLRAPTFGHAGDGNLHVNVMLDRRNRDQMRRAEAFVEDLFEITLQLDGTISGEHGIGTSKLKFLPGQLGPAGLEFQRKLKKAFDPSGGINPGKVIVGK
jgi:glycolate oxidase